MNKIIALLAVMFIVGIITLSLYGLVLGFSASVIVGVIHLVVTPLSFVTGFTMFFFDYDLGLALASALGL